MATPYHYEVCWTQGKTCKACGFNSTEQFTWGFLDPAKALEQSVWVLQQGYTLISVEQ